MNHNDVNPTAADGLDDVEGHGMREVVAGVGAAAVLAGGAAAIVAHQQGGSGSDQSITATDTLTPDATTPDSSPVDLATEGARAGRTTVDAAAHLIGTAAGTSTARVLGTAQSADDAVSPNRVGLMGRVDGYVDDRVDDVRDLRDGALRSVEWTVDTARDTARSAGTTVRTLPGTARGAVEDALEAVRSGTITTPRIQGTVDQARATVNAALLLAGDTVRGVQGTAMTTIARIQPEVGADVDLAEASGWITVSAGGQTLARAEVKDGQASVSWEAPAINVPVTLHYSGTDRISESAVTL